MSKNHACVHTHTNILRTQNAKKNKIRLANANTTFAVAIINTCSSTTFFTLENRWNLGGRQSNVSMTNSTAAKRTGVSS